MSISSEKYEQWRESMLPPIPFPWRNLIETIIRAAEEVHAFLGPGMAADACQAALAHELALRGLAVIQHQEIDLRYKGLDLPARRLDLVVNELLAIDVASHGDATEVEARAAHLQALLRAADLPLGLVIDFGALRLRHGVHRRLNRAATAALALLPRAETASDDPLGVEVEAP